MKKKNQKVTKFKIPSLRNCRTGTQHPSLTPEQYLMFTLQIKLFTEGWRTGIKEKENFRKNHKWNVWTWERGKSRKMGDTERYKLSSAKVLLDGPHGYRDNTQPASLSKSCPLTLTQIPRKTESLPRVEILYFFSKAIFQVGPIALWDGNL